MHMDQVLGSLSPGKDALRFAYRELALFIEPHSMLSTGVPEVKRPGQGRSYASLSWHGGPRSQRNATHRAQTDS